MKAKDKSRLKILVVASAIFLITMQGGYLAQWGINPITFGAILPPGVTGGPVDVTQRIYHVLDEGAAANMGIRVYKDNGGSPGEFSEAVTSATGVITYGQRYLEGETIWIQARVAAPETSGAVTYMTALTPFVVPMGDANDDAVLPSWGIYEVDTSAPTFVVTDQAGGGISGTAANYVNETDTSLIVTVTLGVDDVAYGIPEDFTDSVTSFAYKAGFSIVLTVNCTQDLPGATYSFSEGSNFYYVFNFPMMIDDVSDPASGTKAFTLNTGSTWSNGGGAGANASMTIDIFDGCQWIGGTVDSNSFFNYDSDLNPTVVTTLIHQ